MPTIILNSLPTSFATFVREIRNPLCVITLASDMLKSSRVTSEQDEYLDMIKKATKQISQQVSALLTDDIGN